MQDEVVLGLGEGLGPRLHLDPVRAAVLGMPERAPHALTVPSEHAVNRITINMRLSSLLLPHLVLHVVNLCQLGWQNHPGAGRAGSTSSRWVRVRRRSWLSCSSPGSPKLGLTMGIVAAVATPTEAFVPPILADAGPVLEGRLACSSCRRRSRRRPHSRGSRKRRIDCTSLAWRALHSRALRDSPRKGTLHWCTCRRGRCTWPRERV
mmetsp:Transcript_71269/g.202051  ORF Transcript_71269/g.202051 Transcript_71269/m.202051 type:complete len:207 (-) Transcript_71269:1276-1896(-)